MSERSFVRVALLLSGAALGAVLVLALHQRAAAPSVVVQQAPGTVQTQTSAGDPAVTPPAAAVAPAPPLSSDETHFWRLVEQTRGAADNDTGRQSGLLKDRLTELSAAAIVRFERTRQRLERRLYTWRMWGAASVIEDGCSDDCFRDFRAYVIYLGHGPYESALRNPDSLASVAQDAETGDWENADDVAPDAYSSVTGNDFPYDVPELSGRPAGRRVNLDDRSLRALYPRLYARFRSAR
jgi:hypothetical protein